MQQLTKLPTLQELLVENENSLKQNALTVLLNQDPIYAPGQNPLPTQLQRN